MAPLVLGSKSLLEPVSSPQPFLRGTAGSKIFLGGHAFSLFLFLWTLAEPYWCSSLLPMILQMCLVVMRPHIMPTRYDRAMKYMQKNIRKMNMGAIIT